MAKVGVKWLEADKSPGSRRIGWEKIRNYLKAATTWPMESPGLFVFDRCAQWIRTVPTLPRDKNKRDDVDTTAEDPEVLLIQVKPTATPKNGVRQGRCSAV